MKSSTCSPPRRLDDSEGVAEEQHEKRQRGAELEYTLAPMRSILRGTFEWQALIRPFVSDLAFRCITKRRSESDISFQSYSTNAAVLFVDLCNYSKITSALAHRGASVLSTIVNEYLHRLLQIANSHGGDVVKFAGDAVLIVWEAKNGHEGLRNSILCAAQCVLRMQQQAGEHPVEGTDLFFRIHCGLCCGELDTEIFVAPTHVNSQRLFHAVGGEPLQQIGELVDLAKAGQVCISEQCMEIIGCEGTFRRVDNECQDAFILEHIEIDDEAENMLDEHVNNLIQDRKDSRISAVEEDFIPPGVINLLTHSGPCPTQLAQMRNLCVLFIAMTSSGNPVNWLMEVQCILDTHRCPMIQIIDDDKGVHVVAAINLYESVRAAPLLALDICHELVSRQVGCAIGMAMGSSFCGVTGSSSVACRWDITGPAAVRAARLMQYALRNHLEVAIDESVYEDCSAPFQMIKAQSGVPIKGSSKPCIIFKLSSSRKAISNMILETLALPPVHQDTVDKVVTVLTGPKPRGVIVLTGPPSAGKKLVFQRAAGIASMVAPCLHVCDEVGGLMQLGRTMATWLSHYQDDFIQQTAKTVLAHLDQQRWSRAHDECVRLVNHVIVAGYNSCFIVDRCQHIDDYSISLMRECIDQKTKNESSQSFGISEDWNGRIFFLCTHLPLYHRRTAECFVRFLRRTRTFECPVLTVGEVTKEELREVVSVLMDLKADDDWLDILSEMTGNMVGYFLHFCKAMSISREGPESTGMSDQLSPFSSRTMVQINKDMTVMKVNAGLAMKFTQIYDQLPPRFQLFLKVLTVLNRQCQVECRLDLLKEVLNNIIANEGGMSCCLDTIVLELVDTHLIKIDADRKTPLVSVRCPALSDVVYDVCTPVQIDLISRALIDRLEMYADTDFRVSLTIAALCGNTGEHELQKQFWRQSYQQVLNGTEESSPTEGGICQMKEIINREIEAAGYSSHDILGEELRFTVADVQSLSDFDGAMMLKNYCAPISFGPMGHTLTVITRAAALEILAFREAFSGEDVSSLQADCRSALDRYKLEVNRLEDFLKLHGFGMTQQERQTEDALLEEITCPGTDEMHACQKREHFLQSFCPRFVESRLHRLHLLAAKLRQGPIPLIIQTAPESIRESYKALIRSTTDQNDAVQDALVTLAVFNWQPKLMTEKLPLFHYQTVARLRDEVLHRLSDKETKQFQHQHSIHDFEAFLITTALLHDDPIWRDSWSPRCTS